MSPAALRAFPSFPPAGDDLRWRNAPRARPFPLGGQSGTLSFRFARAAIRAGLQLLKLQPGDEVLMPAYHHGVEVETVQSLGLHIRYYPVGPDLMLQPAVLGGLLSARTRAVYVIHYFGFAQPLAALRRFCSERGLLLFEDCALALFSAVGGVPLGSVGDAAAFCLYKTLPVPDGGLLLLKSDEVPSARARRHDHLKASRDSLVWTRSLLRSTEPAARSPATAVALAPEAEDRRRAGFPFFDPVQLDLAMSPLTRLALRGLDFDEVKRRRRRNYAFWTEAVADHLDCVRPTLGEGTCPLLFPVLVEDKARLHAALLADGIEIHNWWHQWYGGAAPGECPENDWLRGHLVGLPVQQKLGLGELDRILRALRKHLPRQF